MKIYEQADSATRHPITNPCGATYSWILDGVKKRLASKLPGWKWVGGRPGCYVTNDAELAAATANRVGVEIESNGTHAVLGVPVLLCDPRK